MDTNDKKNIALIIPNLAGGGAERVASVLSEHFSENGHCVYIVVRDKNEIVKYEYSAILKSTSMIYMGVSCSDKIKAYGHLYEDVLKLKQLKTDLKIDVSISFMQECNLLNVLSKGADKVVLTNHCVTSKRNDVIKRISWSKYIFKYLYPCADKVICVSEAVKKDWIQNYGNMSNNIEVIYNPVFRQDEQRAQSTIQLDKSKKYIVSVARFDSVKRVWHTIRVFNDVVKKNKDIHLILLGDGDLKNTIIDMVRKFNIEENVHFMGFVENVEDYLKISQLMVVSSASEACSCAIQEALFYGVPVVSNDCPGGNSELLGINENTKTDSYNNRIGRCGIITPYLHLQLENRFAELTNEEMAMSKAIQMIIDDSDLYKKLSQNCRKQSEMYEMSEIGKQWDKLVLQKSIPKLGGRLLIEAVKNYCKICNRRIKKDYIDSSTDKFYSYYQVLEKWMRLRDIDKSISIYFENKSYNRIIIYGMSYMARHLISELEDTNVEIICGIDNRASFLFYQFPVISNEEEIPNADIIVVTVTYEYESIKKNLEKKTSNKIVSLQEVVEETLSIR